MPDAGLPERLFEIPSLRRELDALTLQSVAKQFAALAVDPTVTERHADIPYLLKCASILALSSTPHCQDAALRVAQHVLATSNSESKRTAAASILDSMTNRAAIRLAVTRNYVSEDYWKDLPVGIQLDRLQRQVHCSILNTSDNVLEYLNRFQIDAYRAAQEQEFVSVSAPTSAGKSFVLLRIVMMLLNERSADTIVYIAPTRALIQQVEIDLVDVFSRRHLDVFVTSIPKVIPKEDKRAAVYVFTQERLHWLLSEQPNFIADAVIIDEAHRIGDEARGVLLEQAINEVRRRSNRTRLLFSSPMSSNPELLIDDESVGAPGKVESEHVVVNQNLLVVAQVKSKPKQWTARFVYRGTESPLGTFSLARASSKPAERLASVAHSLSGGEGGNLVYVDSPASAEKAARAIWELEGGPTVAVDSEITELINLIKEIVHRQYSLASVLSRGIAFHYGNMPVLLRLEIERLFKEGKVKFLICTPTLIEGVNLPARSIFIRNPHKGPGRPMTAVDFWNLAGRAGRQGKEFEGNVVCVEPDRWDSVLPRERAKYPMSRRVDVIARDHAEELFEYIRQATPKNFAISKGGASDLEYAFSFFVTEHIGCLTFAQSPVAHRFSDQFIAIITGLCEAAVIQLSYPIEIVTKNPGVSALSMQRLYQFFLSQPFLGDLLPVEPRASNAFHRFEKIITLISEYLDGAFNPSAGARAVVVTNWLKGMPMHVMIDKSWDYWRERIDKKKKLDAVIRDVMKDIEEYVRFRFAKYLGCYTDLLRAALEARNDIDNLEKLPDLRLHIEFGAGTKTQLSLMSLGLSRTSALLVEALIVGEDASVGENLDESDCLFLLGELLDDARLSPIVRAELRRVRDRAGIR